MSLEKSMVTPTRPEVVAGYLLGFSLFALLQSATTVLVVVFVFGAPMNGNPATAFAVILLLGARRHGPEGRLPQLRQDGV